MGKIVVSENVTLDGVIQDPAGDEGFRVGGWVGLIKDRPRLGRLALDEALGAEAFLLGRRSYEWFAARWPSRSGELADRLNSLPKYVVSSTLEHPAWNNSTVLRGDVLNPNLRRVASMIQGLTCGDAPDRGCGFWPREPDRDGVSSVAAFVIGFIPPSQFGHLNPLTYAVLILAGILAVGILPPLLMDRLRKPGWKAAGDGSG
jgi:hypothetical protein